MVIIATSLASFAFAKDNNITNSPQLKIEVPSLYECINHKYKNHVEHVEIKKTFWRGETVSFVRQRGDSLEYRVRFTLNEAQVDGENISFKKVSGGIFKETEIYTIDIRALQGTPNFIFQYDADQSGIPGVNPPRKTQDIYECQWLSDQP
jgi:hypothetical protein